MRLLPLARAVRWTQAARKQLFPEAEGGGAPMVLFAASFNFNKVGAGYLSVPKAQLFMCVFKKAMQSYRC